ncbi:type 1 glutamine amidotransferase [Ferviditalea candida]|uniref:Lipid II isoglutaminyl synthase (glutamine-hydrolyzing) subunit GatD n=1 Tax=Ferviditalea candida TaxID=3108399 RepID=A0ABU5ZHY9_9BACL|nr:glutamine amidotransferase [Paenibacillaceae bacterium T2]
MKQLTLYNFFPNHLNLYGDRGNLQVLFKRCEWRDIQLHIKEVTRIDHLTLSDADLLFWGGGGDREQRLLSQQLVRIRENIKAVLEDGAAGLAICGGYQLLGQYYETLNGTQIQGIQVFDYYTKAEKQRLVGDLMIESKEFGSVIGFENHSGRTYHQGQPLGVVIHGYGNNGRDGTEGFRRQHFIGTYIHGPLLPKNPAIADQLILWALKRKYGDSQLSQLEDSVETQAKNQAIESLRNR